MIKVLFLTNSLGGGGAEKVLVNLANHLDKTKFSVTIKTIFDDGVNLKNLNADVKYSCSHIPSFKGITYFLRLVPANVMFEEIVGNNNYDIIVAFLHGISTKVVSGCLDKNIKRVAWLHYANPENGSFFKCWLIKKDAFRAYSEFDRIVGVSKIVSSAFKNYTKISNPIITLYNVNDTARIINMAEMPCQYIFDKTTVNICTVGRLAIQKGYDRLISATKRLIDEGYQFNLSIIGEGPEYNSLIRQVEKNELGDVVHFLGFCDNPYSIMSCNDLFVSSSREEGLATVLTEALTLGLPIVSTDVSGAKEVLGEHDEFGLVVENSENGIYNGLKKMLDNKELMKKYASTAKNRSILFDTDHTVKEVERMMEELCKN